MGVEGAFFLGRALAGRDLTDPVEVAAAFRACEEPRKEHTARQTGLAYRNGRMFHHMPVPCGRCATWCSSTPLFSSASWNVYGPARCWSN
ncbi:hypothetical protein Acsp04_19520 [Actinomadura sp. NBRC 104425]|uniref:hypothetical protein n=1 Tax=Actinomadura sp. NBRC 104425 TaxID=3032204 RepID=UPI0024A447C7|nr:hypothetical protein [Actinomadura sp. NBRC 104425]GLZ11717.1 hypothetical protein Acsp04_19520 [Actinomadura sp. NBRC 104425]